MRIRDQLGSVFSNEEFREAFGGRGRPGISPGQLALVSVLQFVENLTDRQAAHAVRARIDVKYLLGLELTDPGFDFTVLTGFRQRLLDHGLEERVLDLLLERLAGQGLVSAGGDHPQGDRHHRAGQAGRTTRPTPARPLPTTAHRRHRQWDRTSACQ